MAVLEAILITIGFGVIGFIIAWLMI